MRLKGFEERIIKKPFQCLLCVFTIIFILSFLIISYFEIKSELRSTAEVVLETIHQESNKLQDILKEVESYGLFREYELGGLLHKLSYHNFLIIVIYNKKLTNKVIIERTKNLELINALNSYHKKFFKGNFNKKINFRIINYEIYLFLIEKIKDKGFIEVVYKIPSLVKQQIKFKIIQTIWMIFIVLLLTFFVIFLIINSFIHTIRNFNYYLIHENILSLETVGSMIAKRDSDTAEHNYRVTYYAVKIAENFPGEVNIKALIKGAFLHDIGKIAIPDKILLKPGKLTSEEFEIMKTHVLHGYEIIKNNDFLKDAIDVVLYHHEKFDGTGYMKGLKGEEIPINARIFAVADVFDALTSKRPYKEPFSFEKSLQIIKGDRGKHFCPVVVDVFEKIGENVYKEMKNSTPENLKHLISEIIKLYFYH